MMKNIQVVNKIVNKINKNNAIYIPNNHELL